jgi:hypothetical protein
LLRDTVWHSSRLKFAPLNPFIVRDAGEEHGALITASIGTPLTAEQPPKVIMHRAVFTAEPRGQGCQIDFVL